MASRAFNSTMTALRRLLLMAVVAGGIGCSGTSSDVAPSPPIQLASQYKLVLALAPSCPVPPASHSTVFSLSLTRSGASEPVHTHTFLQVSRLNFGGTTVFQLVLDDTVASNVTGRLDGFNGSSTDDTGRGVTISSDARVSGYGEPVKGYALSVTGSVSYNDCLQVTSGGPSVQCASAPTLTCNATHAASLTPTP